MSAANPRIAILGMHLESNAFAPVSTEQDFRKSCYFEGDAMLAEAAKPAPKPCATAWLLCCNKAWPRRTTIFWYTMPPAAACRPKR